MKIETNMPATRVIPVGGFLGAGKTMVLAQATHRFGVVV